MDCCKINMRIAGPSSLKMRVKESGSIQRDYNALLNHPSINGVELLGGRTIEELMLIGEISNAEILDIWNTVMTD